MVYYERTSRNAQKLPIFFRNVREKLSLCYYCFSQAYPKGVLLVASGIDSNNKEKAVNEILFQLEAIKNGAVTEEEIDDAKKLLCNSIRASGDSAVALHSYFLGNSVFGISDTPEEAMEKIRSVTAEQIVSAAAGIKPDTVYFLCGTEDKE